MDETIAWISTRVSLQVWWDYNLKVAMKALMINSARSPFDRSSKFWKQGYLEKTLQCKIVSLTSLEALMKCTSSGSRSKGCATQFLAMRESPGSIEMGWSVMGMAAFVGQMYNTFEENVSIRDAIYIFTVQLGAEKASLSCQNIYRLAELQVLQSLNLL